MGSSWRLAEIDKWTTLMRRKVTNEHASRRRRDAATMIAVGDTVVIRDRHPVGKFRTPYEKETWTYTKVQGTTVTATQRQNQNTRNVSFFKRAMADTSMAGGEVDLRDSGLPNKMQSTGTEDGRYQT